MRRKPGALLPLELAICETASILLQRGTSQFHGYLLAKELDYKGDTALLTAYGTLYRALGRLEQMGLVTSRWEDPAIPAEANRPGRRLYELTPLGQEALVQAQRQTPILLQAKKRGWAPT